MLFREHSRPFDPTAKSPLNLIIGEKRLLAESEERVFIPSHGPFYTESVSIRFGSTRLVRGVDFECILFYKEASLKTAKEVGVGIQIKRTGLVEVDIDYQVVGGRYQSVFSVLSDLMENQGDQLINPIYWADIVGKPAKFPPAAHRHPYWEFAGWGGLLTPLNQINNAIYFQDRKKYKEAYEYFESKKAQFELTFGVKRTAVLNALKSNYEFFKDPLHRMRWKTTAVNPAITRDGSWAEVGDYLPMTTRDAAKIGTTVMLSEEIVYPQPDNSILDEQENPMLTDDDEWIYQDNEHPVFPGVVEDYDEEFDEQWNLTYIKGYHKVAHGTGFSATVNANRTTIKEGESTIFTLNTYKFTPGSKIPYAIEGVGALNINLPKYGTVTLDQNGAATLNITLVNGSPQTESTQMTVSFMINGGVSKSVPYTLASNVNTTAEVKAFQGLNDVVQTKHTVGDTFYVRVSQHGLRGKVVRVTAQFDGSGGHRVFMNNVAATGTNGGYRDYTMPADGSDLYILVRTEQVTATAVSALNINVSYNSKTLSSLSLPAALLDFTAVIFNKVLNKAVTTMNDEEPFTIQVKHNSTRPISFNVVIIEDTLGAELQPKIPTMIMSGHAGLAESATFRVGRNHRDTPDYLTVQIRSPYLTTHSRSVSITVPAVKEI